MLLGSRVAGAAPSTASIRYTAPPECPGASTFLALLENRTSGTWSIQVGNDHPDIVVEILDEPEAKVGRVRRPGRDADGVREITATDCRDLVQALALSTALSLEEASRPAAPAAALTAAPTPAPPANAGWLAGAGLQTIFLLPSQPMPEAALFVENGRRASRPGLALGRPDVRLALAHARNDLFSGARARFALSTAQLAICPASLGFTGDLGLRFCAAGDLGTLSGRGVSVVTPQTSTFVWAAAGALTRLRWSPGRRIVLEAEVGVAAPLEHTTFVFEMPRVEVAHVATVVASGGLMVGFGLP